VFFQSRKQAKEKEMNGTLIYQVKNVPHIGDKVIVIVNGENFPSGTWYGVLEKMDLSTACVVEHSPQRIIAMGPCTVKLQGNCDSSLGIDWNGKEPVGAYTVYPYAVGMNVLIVQIGIQKMEVKALKKKIEGRKELLREIVKIMKKSLGVEIIVPE